MPFYNDLRSQSDFAKKDYGRVFPEMTAQEKVRTIDGLVRLRKLLRDTVGPRQTESNLVIASWNILELGYGTRHGEAMYYMAEILAAFDLIAVQELTPKRADLDRLMRILGPNWSYIYTDPARGPGSDDESSAYIFNTDRVRPSGLSGELSVWSDAMEASFGGTVDEETKTLTRFAAQRPPHVVGFTTRWKSFSMVNLHLEPGDTKAARAVRLREVGLVLQALEKNRDLDWAQRTILVGDMNLYKRGDQPLIEMLREANFLETKGLEGKSTNVPHRGADGKMKAGHIFDRMFFSVQSYFRIATQQDAAGNLVERGGVVPVFEAVFREGDLAWYRDYIVAKQTSSAKAERFRTDEAAAQENYAKYWRDRQLSDHLPIFVVLETDDTERFLEEKKAEILSARPMV